MRKDATHDGSQAVEDRKRHIVAAGWRGMRGATVSLCVLLIVFGDAAPAFSQERRTLFNMMFGRAQTQPSRADRFKCKCAPAAHATTANLAPRAPPGRQAPSHHHAEAPPPRSWENARKVLVIGDFTAVSIGTGLEMMFCRRPVVGRGEVRGQAGSASSASGLLSTGPRPLPGLLNEVKPAVVVLMIGANDRPEHVLWRYERKV